MERTILFRGKTVAENKWVYGGYHKINDRSFIIVNIDNADCPYYVYEVYPDTVGQFTDQLDAGGKQIFEGDIVYDSAEDENAEIVWNPQTSMFEIEFYGFVSDFDHYYGKELDVIGNIHDEEIYEE